MSRSALSRAAVAALLTAGAVAAGIGTAPVAGAIASVPSATCDGGQQIVDNTSEGVHVKLYTLATGTTEFDVCVRVDQAGSGAGGVLAITPTVPGAGVTNVQTPSQDANFGACQSATPNSIPGSHPIAAGGIAGQPYLIDAFANGSAAWLCLSVGTLVQQRLVVPIVVPTVNLTPGTDVAFYPDPS
jgi:hypothetical protein